jgi:hypothetical protein
MRSYAQTHRPADARICRIEDVVPVRAYAWISMIIRCSAIQLAVSDQAPETNSQVALPSMSG